MFIVAYLRQPHPSGVRCAGSPSCDAERVTDIAPRWGARERPTDVSINMQLLAELRMNWSAVECPNASSTLYRCSVRFQKRCQ